MNIISGDNPIYILILTAISLLALLNIYLFFGLRQTKKNIKIFFAGKKALDLEGVLFEEIKRLKQSETEIKKLSEDSKKLQKMASQSIQKVGVVRFNPFKEVGGNQSFVIALLNNHNDGLIISSLFNREGTRVYAKAIKNGQSEYSLSEEETEALKKAGIK